MKRLIRVSDVANADRCPSRVHPYDGPWWSMTYRFNLSIYANGCRSHMTWVSICVSEHVLVWGLVSMSTQNHPRNKCVINDLYPWLTSITLSATCSELCSFFLSITRIYQIIFNTNIQSNWLNIAMVYTGNHCNMVEVYMLMKLQINCCNW